MKETKEARKERQAQEEWRFVGLLKAAGNFVEPEVPVTSERKWRVDYIVSTYLPVVYPVDAPALPKGFTVRRRIALEIQGFGFGHVGRAGWLRDIEKAQAIAANGWLYVPVTREDIANGNALEALARCGVRVEAK